MKILSIGNFTTGWDGSICDEEHIAKALEELEHEVHRYQRETAWGDISGNPVYDFTLIAQWDGYSEELLKMLPKPLVYWAFDYQADGQEWHQRLIANSDLYLSKRIADSKYPNWQWLSQDFAPSFLDRYTEPIEKDIDVLFTGSYLPWATERNETLRLVDINFNLVIHSVNAWDGFKDVRPPIMDEGLPELYARAKVILSIDHTIEAGYWSDRVAQIQCCGGFVLHRYQPLCEVHFGGFTNFFYNIESCLKGVGHWLEADEDREVVAISAYEFAQERLKVRNRVNDLIYIVENHIENPSL